MQIGFHARRHVVAAALAASLLLAGFGQPAQASPQPPELFRDLSTLSVRIAGSPGLGIPLLPDPVILYFESGSLLGPSTGYHWLVQPSVWSTLNFGPGTSLFTGVPLISNLKVTVQALGWGADDLYEPLADTIRSVAMWYR